MDNFKNVKIIIATHKKYQMPKDKIYLPLHVGKNTLNDFGFKGDNTGENISEKNSSYCELTGLYWGWKNIKCDYLGLCHYRRYFTIKKPYLINSNEKNNYILDYNQIKTLIPKYKIILPKKRKYYIESLYSHYAHTHYIEHLDIVKEIIKEKYPNYLLHLNKVYNRSWGYMFNMYIMEKKLSDEYCEWLFDILFELEKRISNEKLSKFQGRFYGRVSEIIFNCWLSFKLEEDDIPIKEIGTLHIEKVDWYKKGKAFLKAKYFNQKYESSF